MSRWFWCLFFILPLNTFANPWQGDFAPNTQFEVCFTPGGHCTDMIVRAIDCAHHSIDVQAYSFTSKPIVAALVNAERRGVSVDVLLDKSNVRQSHSVLPTLQENHIAFLLDNRPAIAHNKVMIIDRHQVITGSFNFTKGAQIRNAENALIIDSPELAKYYENNFYHRKQVSITLSQYQAKFTQKNNRRHSRKPRNHQHF